MKFTVLLIMVCAVMVHSSKSSRRRTRGRVTAESSTYTAEERRGDFSMWILGYLEYCDNAFQTEDPLSLFRDDWLTLKQLIVYNWMHYLQPTLTVDIKAVLPDPVKEKLTAEDVVNTLKTLLAEKEEEITKAFVHYHYASPDSESPSLRRNKSGHKILQELIIEDLTGKWESFQNWLSNKFTKETEERKKYREIMKVVDKMNHPLPMVHDTDIVMHLQSIFLLYHNDLQPTDNLSIKQVYFDGVPITSTELSVDLLLQGNWKSFSEMEVDNKKITSEVIEKNGKVLKNIKCVPKRK